MSKGDKFTMPARFRETKHNVWHDYIQLDLDYKPLNLGQGFPDFAAPEHVTKTLSQVAASNDVLVHQYTREFGHERLVRALSKLYSQLIGKHINSETEIIVTSGAYEALFACILGHVDVGDEVIIIEPFFDCYEPMVRAAGGIPRFIPLRLNEVGSSDMSSRHFGLDPKELESLFNPKTKVIILNNPNNPLGKVYKKEELELIARLCMKWNAMCISDEVYEWLVYKPSKHVRIATLPGMWERTITIGSAGKTFSVTGWKTGWAFGPVDLMQNLFIVQGDFACACPTPIQEALAVCFEKELKRLDTPDCYFISLPRDLQLKRDYMVKFLTDSGMTPIIPEGGYFMVVDWSSLASMIDLNSEKDKYRDYRFTKWMTKNVGLQGIPTSAFYSESHKHLTEDFVRYCFIKKDESLMKAADLLETWKSNMCKTKSK